MIGFVFRPQIFLSFDIVIFCLAWECITMVRRVAYILELCMTLPFDLNSKIIFLPWICVWQDVFALWHSHTKYWHMGVSPWENMLYTFLTLVWPWLLTYIWVAGLSLVSFTHSFYLVCFCLRMIYLRRVEMFVGLFFKLIVLTNGFLYPCWKNLY